MGGKRRVVELKFENRCVLSTVDDVRKLRVVRYINYYRITESLPKDIQGIFGTINSRSRCGP